mgnify:FL=1
MKVIQLLSLVGVLLSSSAVLAESGGDATFERMMQNNRQAMDNYALQQGKNPPVIKDYAYGMPLDVVKVVNVSRPIKSCGVVPAQMTYEDAKGQLTTLRYTVAGDCRTRG